MFTFTSSHSAVSAGYFQYLTVTFRFASILGPLDCDSLYILTIQSYILDLSRCPHT